MFVFIKKLLCAALCFCGTIACSQAQAEAIHEGSSTATVPAMESQSSRNVGANQAALPQTSTYNQSPSLSSSGGSSASTAVATSLNYVLRGGDLIRIEVFNEQNLTTEARLAADGTVVLPLINAVKLGGFTVGDATALLRDLYGKDYLVNPEITLLIVQYASRLVYVHGQTMRGSTPVQMPPEGEFTLTQAISAAGGITLRGSSTVTIKREKKEGGYEIIRANVKEIYRSDKVSDIPLQENDVIFVDESIL